MSISTRIEAIEQHLTDDYSVLTLAGADLTNVDKNIINLKPTWQERLLYFINNGTDVVWNNWEKVEGTGESLSLNSTEEAPMSLVYKGNTSQETTTGKNLIPTQTDLWEQGAIVGNTGEDTNSTTRLRTKGYYPISNDTNYYVSIQNSNYCFLNIILYDSNKGYMGEYYSISSDINGTRSKLINIPSASIPNVAYYRATVRNTNNTATIIASEIEVAKPQIELGSTATDWEQYVGGVPSPNPDYPQDIHVVSGDNTIRITSENILDITNYSLGSINSTNGVNEASTTTYRFNEYIAVDENVTFYSKKALCTYYYNENKQFISADLNQITSKNTPANTKYIKCRTFAGDFNTFDANDYAIYINDNTYPINLGDIELCKIEDYQDSIKKSTGKNLFNKSSIEEGKRLGSDGLPFVDTSFDLSNYIKVDSNTQYTYSRGSNGSGSSAIAYYDSSKTFISRTMPIMDSNAREVVLTTPSNATYVRITDLKTTLDSMQFEKGNQATSYEPYGTSWYLNKQIGKVVLDGSENWSYASNLGAFYLGGYIGTITNNDIGAYSNKYLAVSRNNYNASNYTIYGNNVKVLSIRDTDYTSVSTFRTYLQTANVIVYYILNTPTTTEITDTTLLSQLEAIKRSYNEQTNISQENNDKPFILDVMALKQLAQ